MAAENRRFTRIPTALPVRIEHAGGILAGVTRDVALKGIFVTGAGELPPDTPVRVEIRLDESAQILADGTTVRSQANGLAIQIGTLEGVESYGHLQRLVLLNSPDLAAADKIESEIQHHLGIKPRDGA